MELVLKIRLFVAILLYGFCNVQVTRSEVIDYPYIYKSSSWNCVIYKLERTLELTIVYCYYRTPYNGGWMNISQSTYLIDANNGHKYKILYADGIPLFPEQYKFEVYGQGVTFKLVFPVLSTNTHQFNLIEEVTNGLKFWGIELREDPNGYLERCERMKSRLFPVRDSNKPVIGHKNEVEHQMVYPARRKVLPENKRKQLKKDPNFKIE